MSVERMVTQAILEDHYTHVLRHIADATDDFSRKTMQLNTLGNVFTVAGSAVLAFGAKSIKVAGQLDYIKKSMAAVEGANQAAFDMQYVDRFAQKSMFTYMDLAEAARKLAIQNVSVKDSLGDIADISASSGKNISQISGLYDALLAGRRVGLALSARGGFSQYGISVKEIFAAAGKPYTGKDLQHSMTPEEVAAAVHKVLQQSGKASLNEKLAKTTLTGAQGMLEDAATRVEAAVGSSNLPGTIALLGKASTALNNLADSIKTIPGFGDKMIIGGGVAVLAGGILKGVAAFRQYKAILDIAKTAGKAERDGEMAKIGIAAQEAEAVATSTGKWGKYSEMLGTVARSLKGVGIAMVALDALKESTDVMADPKGKFFDIAYSQFQRNQAKGFGYAITHPIQALGSLPALGGPGIQQNGFERYADAGKSIIAASKWQPGIDALNRLVPAIRKAEDNWDKTGADTKQDLAERLHTIVENTRLWMSKHPDGDIKEPPRKKNTAGDEDGPDPNKYKIPAKLEYQLKVDQRKVDLLEAQHAKQKELNAAKQIEIDHLITAASLLRKNAALATDETAKYKMLDEADEDQQKAKLLKIGKKKGFFDEALTAIISSAGLGEDEIMKRAGIGKKFFRSFGKDGHHAPEDPLKKALTEIRNNIKTRPLRIDLHLGDKVVQTLTAQVKDDVLHEMLAVLQASGAAPRLGTR